MITKVVDETKALQLLAPLALIPVVDLLAPAAPSELVEVSGKNAFSLSPPCNEDTPAFVNFLPTPDIPLVTLVDLLFFAFFADL